MKSIRARMLSSFFIVVALFVLLSIYYNGMLYQSQNSADEIANEQLPLLIAEENLNVIVSNLIATARGYLLSEGDFQERFDMHVEEFEEYANQASQLAQQTGSAATLDELLEENRQWIQAVQTNVFGVYDRGNEELARSNFDSLSGDARELIEGYRTLVAGQEKVITEMEQQVIAQTERSVTVGITVVIVAVIIALILAHVVSNDISKKIRIVMEQLKAFGEGKFDRSPIHVKSKDEIAQMAIETNTMQQNIKRVIQSISDASNSIASHSEELMQSAGEVKTVSEQIAGTMQELASGSESQASHASEVAAGVEKFNEMVEEADRNGRQIEASSKEVIEMTGKGSELMNRSEVQMENIDTIVQESVEKVKALDVHYQDISKFVAVIQEIANQTNLLALNASIEAARAGEQGRGFAVVAEEIRKLAEQSADSVTEIIELVNNIQEESKNVTESLESGYEEVQQGTVRIRETSETFHEIKGYMDKMVLAIEKVSASLREIAAGSQKMSGSIQEIASLSEESSASVEQTSASTQQTMSSMEEVAASSEQLAKLAEEMNEEVAKFKI